MGLLMTSVGDAATPKTLKDLLLAETPRADIPVPRRGRLRAREHVNCDGTAAPD